MSVHMPVATCRYILVFSIRGVGRIRFIYLKRGKKEMQTSCKNPLLTPLFTFCYEKELNLHVNSSKLKHPLYNSERKKKKIINLICLPFSIFPDSTETHHKSTEVFCKCLLLYGSPAVSSICFLGNVEDAMHQINFSFFYFLSWTPMWRFPGHAMTVCSTR